MVATLNLCYLFPSTSMSVFLLKFTPRQSRWKKLQGMWTLNYHLYQVLKRTIAKLRCITSVLGVNLTMNSHSGALWKKFMSLAETSTCFSKHNRVLLYRKSAPNVIRLYMQVFFLYFLQLTDFQKIAGPMWSAPIQDAGFIGKVLEHLETNQDKYGTATRMKGMLTVAKEVCYFPVLPFCAEKIIGNRHCILFHASKSCKCFPLWMPWSGRSRVSPSHSHR